MHYGTQQSIHTGQYLISLSKHSSLTKQGIIRTLYKRAPSICSTKAALNNKIFKIKEDLKRNGYSERLIETTISRCKQRKQLLTLRRLLHQSKLLEVCFVKQNQDKGKMTRKTASTKFRVSVGIPTQVKPKDRWRLKFRNTRNLQGWEKHQDRVWQSMHGLMDIIFIGPKQRFSTKRKTGENGNSKMQSTSHRATGSLVIQALRYPACSSHYWKETGQ